MPALFVARRVLRATVRTMRHLGPEDLIVLSMSMDALLASVRQTEAWSRFQNDGASVRRTRLLEHAIIATRRKFFADIDGADANDDVTKALFIADGLRDAAQQCHEGQGALHERLIGGAETIERLCRPRGGRP